MSKYSPLIPRALRKLSQAQLAEFSNEDWESLLQLALTTGLGNQIEHSSQSVDKVSDRFSEYRNKAIVVNGITPLRIGRIWFQGAWWNAQCEQQITLLPGEVVEVVGRKNITLLVQPIELNSQEENNIPLPLTQTNQQTTETASPKTYRLVQSGVEKGDRTIAFSAGGAFLGGLIAQVPGAIVGALAGAIFGWFEKSKPANSSESSR